MLPPPRRVRRALGWAPKLWAWLQGRRTARAIHANQVAVVALTASVAAAGVGGYAAHEAAAARHETAALSSRLNTVEALAQASRIDVAGLRDAVTRLDTKDARQLDELGPRLTAVADLVKALGSQVAALPPAPSLGILTARVAGLAKTTRDAARKAELATVAAADQHDRTARAAAERAFSSASAARAVADDALVQANAAHEAASAGDVYDPIITHFPDLHVAADVGAVPAGRAHLELTRGEYQVRLDVDGSSIAYDWYLSGAGQTIHGTYAEKPQHYISTGLLNVAGPLDVELTAYATGGDFSDLSALTLTLTRVRS